MSATTTRTSPPIPAQETLDAFLGQFVADLGATTTAVCNDLYEVRP